MLLFDVSGNFFLFYFYFILWFLSTDCQVKTSVEWVPRYYFDSLFLAWGFDTFLYQADTLFTVGEGKRPYTSWLNSISATPSPCEYHYCFSFLLWAISMFLTLLISLFRATRRYVNFSVEVLYCLTVILCRLHFPCSKLLPIMYQWSIYILPCFKICVRKISFKNNKYFYQYL